MLKIYSRVSKNEKMIRGLKTPNLAPIKYNNRWSYNNTIILYKITIISCVYLIRWTRVYLNIYFDILDPAKQWKIPTK
jgi:hypothetical protein